MNNKELNKYKETLIKEKERVTNLIDELQDDTPFGDHKHPTSQRYATGELSAYDNHPGDMGTEVFMQEMQMNLANQHKYRADVIDRALDKIDLGTYGTCDVCGKKIENERLEILPETTVCAHCSKEMPENNMHEYRPIEEALIDKDDYFYSDLNEYLADINRPIEHDAVDREMRKF